MLTRDPREVRTASARAATPPPRTVTIASNCALGPNGSTSVPIHDIKGSTIGLVGESNTLTTQWSYESFGAPTLSGAQSALPFLFGGAQYDPTGYSGSYSPRLAHSLSGGAVPYTGQGYSEFGHVGTPPPFHPGAPSSARLAHRRSQMRD